ncbi:MAG: thymidylate kinase, partial [Eubacterium sp.]
KGQLIVIEGVDGSGKETQTDRLYKRLREEKVPVMKVSYPRYDKDSSAMVRAYLAGEFGSDPDAVSPYIASTFYAADRYASYKEDYEDFYKNGGIVIADRYTTSNMVHQAGKIQDWEEREKFMNWLTDYEFNLLGLPKPDRVFFLNISPEINRQLIAGRANKITGGAEKDIHEKSSKHLRQSYANAIELSKRYHWIEIHCVQNGELRSIDAIHQEIYEKIMEE